MLLQQAGRLVNAQRASDLYDAAVARGVEPGQGEQIAEFVVTALDVADRVGGHESS